MDLAKAFDNPSQFTTGKTKSIWFFWPSFKFITELSMQQVSEKHLSRYFSVYLFSVYLCNWHSFKTFYEST